MQMHAKCHALCMDVCAFLAYQNHKTSQEFLTSISSSDGFIMRRMRLAVFVTGTPSKSTMDLPENGAIITSVGSRDSASFLFLHRVGVTFTWWGADKDRESK